MHSYHISFDISGVKFYYRFTTTAFNYQNNASLSTERIGLHPSVTSRSFIFHEFIHDDPRKY